MMVSEGGLMICIGVSDIREIGRNTQGVRLVRLKPGDKLVSAAVLEPEEIEEDGVETAEADAAQPEDNSSPADVPTTDGAQDSAENIVQEEPPEEQPEEGSESL
jgi:DNA gyrase subunit A